MIIDNMADKFSDTLANALNAFFRTKGMSEAQAATRMEMKPATLNTYTTGAKDKGKERKRRRPPAELLARACLLGFEFEFQGYVIGARKEGQPASTEEKQLHLQFTRQIDLAENGAITVGLKRPPGKIELSVSLREVS
jgi:hypothetical protein